MNIIALGYRQGVGKTYAANYLETKYKFKRVELSGPLKNFIRDLCVEPGLDLNSQTVKSQYNMLLNTTYRNALQSIGNFMKERFGGNILCKAAFVKYRSDFATGNIVIPDLRSVAEFDFIRNIGGFCVKITRGEEFLQNYNKIETELAAIEATKWDYILANNGTKEEFEEQLDKMYNYLCWA